MPTAINVDDLASDVGGAGEQKEQGLFHFVDVRPAFHRDIFCDLWIRPSISRRKDGTEGKSVDDDLRGKCDRHGFGHRCQRGFADGVGEMIRAGAQGAPIEDVDDA